MNIHRLLISTFAISLTSITYSQAPSASTKEASDKQSPQRSPYTLANTEERWITSKAGKEYRIMISWPAAPAPKDGYPITYVLDGDDLFPLFTSVLKVQAGVEKAALHNAISPGLVVGIGYRKGSGRNVDYTPAASKGAPETYRDGRPYPPQESGGADAFFDFLEKELKPAIEKDYSVNRARQSLFGNGYGGLFALHILFTRPEAFQTYVASSPSVWWNDRYILQEEKGFTEKVKSGAVKAQLVMTVGDMEQTLTPHEYSWPEEPREEHALKVTRRRMLDNTREMSWRLEKFEGNGFVSSFQVFAGQSHKSVVPMAISHALPFVFPPAGKE